MPFLAACIIATASAAVAWSFGTRTAGGADAYGYVSQSLHWLEGGPAQPPPLAGLATWPGRVETLTTLTELASDDRTLVVPVYPAGLPLMMAAMRVPFGECGPFLIAPAFAAFGVITAFLLARRMGGGRFAPGAALLVAVSPAFLSSSMWPMSDIVVTGLWGAAIVLALDERTSRAAGAGLLAGAAVAVRPNLLVVLIAFIAGIAVLERGRRVVWPLPVRAVVAGLAAVPLVVLIAAIQAGWYGAPWRSGYGPFRELYDLANVLPNARQYGWHLLSSQSPFVLFAAIPLARGALGLRSMVDRREAVFFTLFIGAFAVAYLPYTWFEHWGFLRFFLPAILVVIVLAVAGASMVASARPWGGRALAVMIVAVAAYSLYFAYTHAVFTQHQYQRAYVSVARYLEGLPRNAAIISTQHSGSVRYYAGRLTVRWDWMRGAGLDRILDDLRRLGYRPYILLEDWEEPRFVSRFDPASRAGRLDLPVIARMTWPMHVRLFDPLGTEEETRWRVPDVIPMLPFRGCPARADTMNW